LSSIKVSFIITEILNMKEIFSAKIVAFDIKNGGGITAILNAEQAAKF
jgi:hypothetical protein